MMILLEKIQGGKSATPVLQSMKWSTGGVRTPGVALFPPWKNLIIEQQL